MKEATLILFTLSSFGLSAQVGNQFPELKGETLSEDWQLLYDETRESFEAKTK